MTGDDGEGGGVCGSQKFKKLFTELTYLVVILELSVTLCQV